MKKFIIENHFWEIFPEAKIGVVLCKGIDNQIKDTEKYEKLLRTAEKEIKSICLKNNSVKMR